MSAHGSAIKNMDRERTVADRKQSRITKSDKTIVKNGYEAIAIIDDLLMGEVDESRIEKLKLLRKDVSRIVNANRKINTKENN